MNKQIYLILYSFKQVNYLQIIVKYLIYIDLKNIVRLHVNHNNLFILITLINIVKIHVIEGQE